MRRNPAAYIIKQFGGVRPLARLLGIDHSAVSRWRSGNGLIPTEHQRAILKLASKHNKPVTTDDVV